MSSSLSGGGGVRPGRESGRPSSAFHIPEVEDVDVVVVDDERVSLSLLQRSLEQEGHPVRGFSDSTEALEAVRTRAPSVLVTDLAMPGLTGVDLVEQARLLDPDIGVVLVTGSDEEEAFDAARKLDISSYVAKPVDRGSLTMAVRRAFLQRAADEHHREMMGWMREELDRSVAEIREVTLGTLASLMNALDARSPHFRGHSRAVALQAAAIADTLGLDEDQVEEIRISGLLHDIGMIGVSDTIVDKPDSLTPEEAARVRSHCTVGASIIEPMKHVGSIARYVLEHHERLDGSGYPAAKKGDEISLGGQIVGISEAWSGILANRAYREGREREEAMEILTGHRGSWFSDELTDALIESDMGVMN